MPVKKPDFTRIKKRIDGIGQNLPIIGNNIVYGIVRRTQRGLDVNNKKFKRYSKGYGKYKAKEYGSKDVNLTQSGKMLNSITWRKTKNGIRIYFRSREESQKAHGNQKRMKRVFFGLDKEQIKYIKKEIKKL